MKFALAGVCILGLLVGSAGGATEWTETKTQIDEVAADTTSFPPASGLRPIDAAIPFSNFRYPHVDAEENVTFIADDPVKGPGKASNHGIYRSLSATGRLETLVSTVKTVAPGTTAKFEYIRGLQMADNLVDFVFSGISTDNRNGIYAWKNGTLRTVARTGETVLPGETEPITGVEYGSFSDGRILFVAHQRTGSVVALADLAKDTRQVLVRTGDPMPGDSATEGFRYFSPQNWSDGSSMVFRAARVIDPYDPDVRGIAQRGIYGWVPPAGSLEPDYSAKALRRFVDWNTPVPDRPEERFTDLRSSPVSGNIIAFAGASQGGRGLYWIDATTGTVRTVVDTDTAMDGLFEGTFQRFAQYPSVIEGSIAFVAYAADYVGIFHYDPARDELRLLTDNRSPVEGKTIVDFEIASRCLVGDRLAVQASFADGSQGIYLATIPANAWAHR